MIRLISLIGAIMLVTTASAIACPTVPYVFFPPALEQWQINDDFTAVISCFGGPLDITDTTASTSDVTGAVIVAGGVGIGGNLNVGHNTDPHVADFGIVKGSVITEGDHNGFLAYTVGNGEGGVPSSSIAVFRLDATGAGNYGTGFYGEGILDTNGLAMASELDTFSKVAPTTTLPPIRGPLPLAGNLTIGLTLAAATKTGYSQDSVMAIDVESNGGKYAAAGIYVNPAALTSPGVAAVNVPSHLLQPILSSALPTCDASHEGMEFAVTDASVATFNTPFIPGGGNHVKAYCNGTAWVVH